MNEYLILFERYKYVYKYQIAILCTITIICGYGKACNNNKLTH